MVLGMVFARRTPLVTHVDIPIVELPEEFQNFKIAQISDLHVGHTIKQVLSNAS